MKRFIYLFIILYINNNINVLFIYGLPPIIIRGNKMYESTTGKRFIMKGITYEYAVSDEHYTKYGSRVFTNYLKDLKGKYNTARLYNVNPDKSYDLFMADMETFGIYVLVSASPALDNYFGSYKYSTMRKDLNPTGKVIIKDGKSYIDQTQSCYPSLLLNYGKKIAKVFAKYDHTLGIVIANEILQETLTAAACVKQYVADLKNWMRVYGKFMRMVPIAYAAADSAYGKTGIPDADTYGPIKIQGLLCGDTMVNGMMYESIDIYLLNTYRWCGHDSTYISAFKAMVQWASGLPIVISLGEFGCKTKGDAPRTWELTDYLFGKKIESGNMIDVFSGGTAYSYGEANQGSDSAFPMFTGGSVSLEGEPSMKPTEDYKNLVAKYTSNTLPNEKANWDSNNKCQYVPTIQTKVDPSNKNVDTLGGWIIKDCTKIQSGSAEDKDTTIWTTTTRQGASCDGDGMPCEVSITSKLGTSEEDICGYVTIQSGGAVCSTDSDCGRNGRCNIDASEPKCECLGCYTGSKCTVLDPSKCGGISSVNGVALYILVSVGSFVGFMGIILIILYTKSKSLIKKNSKLDNQIRNSVLAVNEVPVPNNTISM